MQKRTLALEGAVNLRDFGGYETLDGGRVRPNHLFRSGILSGLTEAGRAAFAELDVKLICDLRRADEKAGEPTPMFANAPSGVEIPIDPGSAIIMRERLTESGLTLADSIDFMVSINRDLARDHAEDYAQMFVYLMALEEGAFLVHCSAGKDRTGFACALILQALGVPRATVLQDYLLTNEAMDYEGYVVPRLNSRPWLQQHSSRESIMALFGVRPEYLQAAYDAIASEFEDVEQYIDQAIGLGVEGRRRLRSRYVVNGSNAPDLS